MARTLWGLQLQENTVRTTMRVMSQLKLIGGSNKRDRRLQPGEYIRLLRAAGKHWIADVISVAVHSSLRQEEIHKLHFEDIDWETTYCGSVIGKKNVAKQRILYYSVAFTSTKCALSCDKMPKAGV